MTHPIENYALIGDCQTAALVAPDGSIDWLCWPRFDSGACFAALLGSADHGRWRIAPRGAVTRSSRRYREDTLILETDLETESGIISIIDFMPVREAVSDLVRIVIGRRGSVEVRMELALRFGYGAQVPWVSRLEDGSLRAVAGPDRVVLRTPVALRGEGLITTADFSVEAGDTIPFVLTYSASHEAVPAPIEPLAALQDTEQYWRDWSRQCAPAGPYTAGVRRSLITLKALTYEPTGGMVTSPTTSLPDGLGSEGNWDYRYCRLRDATLTLLALMNANYHEEAIAWQGWLQRAIAGSPDQMQMVYSITGERRLPEWTADWLPGYQGKAPVRIGNAAASEFQLDVLGEVMDTLHQSRKAGFSSSADVWGIQVALIDHLERVLTGADDGLWDMPGAAKSFTFSKVMAWVGLDRAVRDIETYGLPGPLERWRKLRSQIHADVCENSYSEALGSFVQSAGSEHLDASLLMIPLTGFLPPEDERVRSTIAAIEKNLSDDGLIVRIRTNEAGDGLSGGGGRALACSFWMIDNWILQGRLDEAHALFERLLALRSDVGLLAEEYDPESGRAMGNFPQAFSHVALVNTALNLARATSASSAPPGRDHDARAHASGRADSLRSGSVTAMSNSLR